MFLEVRFLKQERGSAVGTAIGYGLNDRGSEVRIVFITASRLVVGPTQPLNTMRNGGYFPGRKAAGA
jgi:hypothetical protein